MELLSIYSDKEFLSEYGAEIILEVAQFINSIVTFNSLKNKFEILGVMGPDEYHEKEILTQNPELKIILTPILWPCGLWREPRAHRNTKSLSKKLLI